jgi:hypothetical protein
LGFGNVPAVFFPRRIFRLLRRNDEGVHGDESQIEILIRDNIVRRKSLTDLTGHDSAPYGGESVTPIHPSTNTRCVMYARVGKIE